MRNHVLAMTGNADAIVTGILRVRERFPGSTTHVGVVFQAHPDGGAYLNLSVYRDVVDEALEKHATRRDLRRPIAEAGLPRPHTMETRGQLYFAFWNLPLAWLATVERLNTSKWREASPDDMVASIARVCDWLVGSSVALGQADDHVFVELSVPRRAVKDTLGSSANRSDLRRVLTEVGLPIGAIETRRATYVARWHRAPGWLPILERLDMMPFGRTTEPRAKGRTP
jgi:hypothetical protein